MEMPRGKEKNVTKSWKTLKRKKDWERVRIERRLRRRRERKKGEEEEKRTLGFSSMMNWATPRALVASDVWYEEGTQALGVA